jgi:hypothetical protein
MTDTEFAQKPNKRALRRKLNMSKARRKAFISRNVYGLDWYRHLHQYSKNKIHCSCGLCRSKTNNKTHKHVWFPAMNWQMCDLRRIQEMDDEERDFEEGGDFSA